MMSVVEEAPRLVTGDYGRHRRQRVKNVAVTLILDLCLRKTR